MPQKSETSNAAGAPSIISTDVVITGDLESRGELQLDGTIEGNIRCETLVLGEKGRVTGNIRADSVTLRGSVTGTIEARVVRLEKTARLSGDVLHETLSVEAGAEIDGQMTYASRDEAKKALSPQKSASPAGHAPDSDKEATPAPQQPPQAAE